MVQISLRVPPPSTITHIMYLKCLLHNLCSINFCFKGCDTTSAYYFPRLCSFWALCLNCFMIDWLVCVCVCLRESAMILQSKVQLHLKAKQSTDDEHWTMCVSPNQNIRKTSYKQKENVLIFQLRSINLQLLVWYFRYFKKSPHP